MKDRYYLLDLYTASLYDKMKIQSLAQECDVEMVKAQKKDDVFEITNPYEFGPLFEPPLTRRQRRELARKNKKH